MTATYSQIMQVLGSGFLPTKEQERVIVSSSPTILVVAGAGSGKTATMTNRIAYQIATGVVRPDQVLGLTFTRKAAGELAERVDRALGLMRSAGIVTPPHGDQTSQLRDSLMRPNISTYNSFASEISTSYGLLVGGDPGARLMTEAERYQVMASIVDQWPAGEDHPFGDYSLATVTEACLTLASGLIDNQVSLSDASAFFDRELSAIIRYRDDVQNFARGHNAASKAWTNLKNEGVSALEFRRNLLQVVERYFDRKVELGLTEFADQVTTASSVLAQYPQLGADIAERYRLVLLDEYQDTSVNQARFLVNALAPAQIEAGNSASRRSICAVGDPNQAIYGWRGASANALEDFVDQFGARMEAPERLTLSTSFRNDIRILDAANAVARSLNRFSTQEESQAEEAASLNSEAVTHDRLGAPAAHLQGPTDESHGGDGMGAVGTLQPRTGAGPGRVVEVRPWLRSDSYRAIAWRIRDVINEVRTASIASGQPREAEIAVLCRKRSYIDLMAEALLEVGIPYEVVGGESLVMRPEILTIRAALGVLAKPSRNDLLLRLITLFNIGTGDLRVLHSWSTQLAAYQARVASQDSQDRALNAREERSLIEAVADLPKADWTDRHGSRFSPEAYQRLSKIAAVLERLRGSVHMPLPDLVSLTSQLLGLDLAAASRLSGSQRVRTSIDSFISLSGAYANDHPGCSLEDFVAWLEAVEAREHGGEEASGEDYVGESEDVEVHAGTVQIMTIHAAKGLEWRDLVVVPEMVDSQFSTITGGVKAWPQNKAIFPYPLRADYRHLPTFEVSECADKFEAGEAYSDFKVLGLTRHESMEARRLAYVAFTRPQRELLLAGYACREAEAKTSRKKDVPGADVCIRSQFLADIRAGAHVTPVSSLAGEDWPPELVVQAPESASVAEVSQALGLSDVSEDDLEPVPDFTDTELKQWPRDVQRSLGDGTLKTNGFDFASWVEQAEVLAAEAYLARSRGLELERPYYTATDVVHLADDPHRFILDQRRPVPNRPSRAARTGTEVHARIAHYFGEALTIDVDSLIGQDGDDFDEERQIPAEERNLFDAFERSRWSKFPPIAVEQSLEIVVEGKIVRCTIDAVLDTSSDPDLADVTIVDWKSGRRPSTSSIPSRELQLALYRLAWSRNSGSPLDAIDARFVYLREDESRQELAAGRLSELEIGQRIQAALQEGRLPAEVE